MAVVNYEIERRLSVLEDAMGITNMRWGQQMDSVKSFNDRILRLELKMSNIADEIAGIHNEVKQLMEDIRAYSVTRTTEDDASDCSGS